MGSRYSNLHISQTHDVVTLAMNRPEKRNALTPVMMDEMMDALDRIEACACGVLVLTGVGEAFCAGMDIDHLKSLVSRSVEEHQEDSNRVARLMRRIYDFPKPTIAAVNGAAIAGGTGLVCVCDFAYAVPEAKFGYTEARIGFVPAIVSAFLVPQVGERVARDLLLTARIIKAAEALHLGLLNGVVEQSQLMATVQNVCRMLLANSPGSVRTTKKLLSAYAQERLDFELKHAITENAFIRTQPDFLEGVSSFLEKRTADWPSRRQAVTKPC